MLSYVAIGLLFFALFLGLVVLISVLSDKTTPKSVVFIHGGLAFIALTLVFITVLQKHAHGPIIAFSILTLAAIGGLRLFYCDMRKKPIPKWLALLHPLIAIIGLFALIFYALF